MFNLNGANLRKVCTKLSAADACDWAERISRIAPTYGIANANILHEFLANCAKESGEFAKIEEDLYYTTPERVFAVWPSKFKNADEAVPYLRNPKKLATKVYDNHKQLGNIQPGDGWLMRGGGLIHTTGRDNYTLLTSFINNQFGTKYTIAEVAELCRTDRDMAVHSACWIFAIAKKLIPFALRDDLNGTIKRITGSMIGKDERKIYFDRAVKWVTDF